MRLKSLIPFISLVPCALIADAVNQEVISHLDEDIFLEFSTQESDQKPSVMLASAAPLATEANQSLNASSIDKKWYYQSAIKQREGGGIGYNHGYTSFQTFFARKLGEQEALFIDLRAHAFNTGKFATNIGLGYRFKPWAQSTTFGFNAYYDYRGTSGLQAQQVGAGFEVLSHIADFRINGYVPIGRIKADPSYKFSYFEGNYAYLNKKRKTTLNGADAEIGKRLTCFSNFNLYGALGAYYFQRDEVNTHVGGKARLKADFWDRLSLEASLTHDHLFKTRVQGEIAFHFPIGKDYKDKDQRCSLNPDLFEIPYRQEIIATKKAKKTVTARDALGNPMHFVFVDSAQTNNGNGTYELPFTTLSSLGGQTNSMSTIYLKYGNGNIYDGGITMYGNQTLLGSGIDQTVQSRYASFTIPAQTPNQTPTITNSSGAGIMVQASSTNQTITINGINIYQPSTLTIDTVRPNNTTFNVSNCILTQLNGSAGAVLLGSGANVNNCTFIAEGDFPDESMLYLDGAINITNNKFYGGNITSLTSILAGNESDFCTGVIANNTYTSINSTGSFPTGAIVVFANNTSSPIDIAFENNTFSGTYSDSVVELNKAVSTYPEYNVNFQNNNFTNVILDAGDDVIFENGSAYPITGVINSTSYPAEYNLTNIPESADFKITNSHPQ